jgi:hypothetical protein
VPPCIIDSLVHIKGRVEFSPSYVRGLAICLMAEASSSSIDDLANEALNLALIPRGHCEQTDA